VLGIDDWSFRKGRTYGTILVDLEKQQPVDLLPDRESETLAAWLEEHPGVEIISRDRASAYSEAATKAAPDAIQIADRWHLLKNAGEATQRLLRGKEPLLKTATRKAYGLIEGKSSKEGESPEEETETDQHLPPGESIRKVNFEQVKIMQKAGKSVRYMHRELGIHRQTIRNYMACETLPRRRVASMYYSTATPHIAFIEKRWKEGVKSPTQLWRELQEKGAKVSKSSVYRMTIRLFGMVLGPRDQQVKPPTQPPILSARKTSILLSKDPDKLNKKERKFCEALKELSPEIDQAYPLIQDFVKMVKQQKVKMLDSWLEQALESELPPMVNFATSLRQDYHAVKAALEYKWSNGQVEGQVNRLKMIKRQMYGRAGFQLLRKRVVYAPRPG
jgi:transposase